MGIVRTLGLAFVLVATGIPSSPWCRGEQFAFDVPDLVGSYQNSSRQISLDLGMKFSNISSVSLQVAGNQVVGSFSDLNFAGSFPYPAEVSGWLSELKYAGFESTMPSTSGQFDETHRFRVYAPLESTDFGLLDGTAKFRFGAGGGFLVATTYVTRFARVSVESATLLVDGTALALQVGDYTGDGVVDDLDYVLWRETYSSETDLRSDGNSNGAVDAGDFTVWRGSMSVGGAASTFGSSVPEPATVFLAIIASGQCVARRRRKPTAAA